MGDGLWPPGVGDLQGADDRRDVVIRRHARADEDALLHHLQSPALTSSWSLLPCVVALWQQTAGDWRSTASVFRSSRPQKQDDCSMYWFFGQETRAADFRHQIAAL